MRARRSSRLVPALSYSALLAQPLSALLAFAAMRRERASSVSAGQRPVVGATGFEPVTSSVSGTAGGSRRPAVGGGVCPVTSADGGPLLSVVVRCDPVVRGPDVAPMWPSGPEFKPRSAVPPCLGWSASRKPIHATGPAGTNGVEGAGHSWECRAASRELTLTIHAVQVEAGRRSLSD